MRPTRRWRRSGTRSGPWSRRPARRRDGLSAAEQLCEAVTQLFGQLPCRILLVARRRDSRAGLVELVEEDLDHGGIELAAGRSQQLGTGRVKAAGSAVAPVAGDRLVRVAYRDDPGRERDVLADDPVGIAAPVP